MTKNLQITEEQLSEVLSQLQTLLRERATLKGILIEQAEKAQAEKEQLFLELLEMFDTLEYLITYLGENPEPNPKIWQRLPKSIATMQKKLLMILERREVSLINFEGTEPDFKLCQVVDCEVRPDLPEKSITKIVRSGFQISDRLLRPVEVITAKNS